MKKLIIAIMMIAIVATSVLAFAGCDNTSSNLIGFDTDLAKAVAEELGVEVKFQEISWGAKETELASKNIDLIWNGLTISADRIEAFEISSPYLYNKQVAVIRKADKSKYTNVETIANGKVTYENGSAGAILAEEKNFPDQIGVQSQMMAITEVLSGTSDVAILDSVLANFYVNSDASYSSLMVVDIDAPAEQYGIAARKKDVGTIDKINTALRALAENGKLEEIANKYGLTSELCLDEIKAYESKWDTLTAEQKSGWEYIQNNGKFVVGYTFYAPIAYTE